MRRSGTRPGETTFYVNLDNDHWSSLDIGMGRARRQPLQGNQRAVRDAFQPVRRIWRAALSQDRCGGRGPHRARPVARQQIVLPLYVSVEDCRFGFQYMETLASCGYDAFKLLDQSTVCSDDGSGDRPWLSGRFVGPIWRRLAGGMAVPRGHGDVLFDHRCETLQGDRLAPRTQWWDIHCTHSGKCGRR